MTIIEAREALTNTFENIKAEAKEKGVIADYKCFASDRDLNETDVSDSTAALIAGELTLGADGTDEKVILECAVSITDGEVFDDEMLREITAIRESVRELYAKIDEAGSAVAALSEIYKESEESVPEVKTYDNKKFYIGAGIAVIIIIIIMILAGNL